MFYSFYLSLGFVYATFNLWRIFILSNISIFFMAWLFCFLEKPSCLWESLKFFFYVFVKTLMAGVHLWYSRTIWSSEFPFQVFRAVLPSSPATGTCKEKCCAVAILCRFKYEHQRITVNKVWLLILPPNRRANGKSIIYKIAKTC